MPFSPEQVAGCYRLTLWPDESGPDVERRRAGWGSAPILKLDTTRLTAWPSLNQRYGTVFTAFSITESGEVRDHPFNYWRFMDGDSVYVGHPAAFAGVSIEAQIEGQDLVGTIISFSDVRREGRPSGATSPVRAVRMECPDSVR
ncbi:MAG: hypothetical protein OER90_13715 [Gemmatimonadota bacterium]|nr:hypothetical protein [Gemmatimonadota bacterium]